MRLDLPAVFFSTALACAVTANAAPFAVGRSTHVSLESADARAGLPAGHARDAAVAPLVSAGLVIDATFDASITGDPNAAAIEAAINGAIGVFEALFTDPITVSILFRQSTTYADGTTMLPSAALSVSQSVIYVMPWNTYVGALTADATSSSDLAANASLPDSPLTPSMAPSSADGRALRLDTPPAMFADGSTGSGAPYDGIVTLNSSKLFTFGRPPAVGTYDGQRTIEHEIDEVLGLGAYAGTGGAVTRPQDLFSWSSPDVRNVTTSGSRYFSTYGGFSHIANFNQDPSGDFGDWLSDACPQANPYVQNAFSCTDQTSDVTATSPEGIDLDVIGYDLVGVSTTTMVSATTTTSMTTTTVTTNTSTTTIFASTTTSTTLLTVLSVAACPDAAEATAIEVAVEAQCDCAGARDHGTFVRCATRVAKNALKAGTLSKTCKLAVIDCAGKSTCGKSGFVTCCRTTAKGKTTCSIKRDAAHCKAPKHGTACPGQRPSCCDACPSGGCP
jgi:hypothetical protein